MIFTTRHYQCAVCKVKRDVLAWDYDPLPVCCGQTMEPAYLRAQAAAVQDDQIEGGPRFFETLGHEPVWIESKSQLKREAELRGYENVVRHDQSYYKRLFKQHDEMLRDTGQIKH